MGKWFVREFREDSRGCDLQEEEEDRPGGRTAPGSGARA